MTKIPAHILRRIGYYAERQGIANRYLRQSAEWVHHLEQTRNFVLQAAADKNISVMAVLGSGWLIDLPLDMIRGMADRILLYDIAHPAQIIHKIRQYKQVEAIFEDVTGGAVKAAYQAVREYRRSGIKPDIQQIFTRCQPIEVDADFIVSLNLMSQLGTIIIEYLARHIPYQEDELNEFNGLIQSAHLQLLKRTHSCLVTDYREITINMKSGKKETRKLIFTDLPESGRSLTWDWNFDSTGSYYPGKSVILNVIGFEIHPGGVGTPRRDGNTPVVS